MPTIRKIKLSELDHYLADIIRRNPGFVHDITSIINEGQRPCTTPTSQSPNSRSHYDSAPSSSNSPTPVTKKRGSGGGTG